DVVLGGDARYFTAMRDHAPSVGDVDAHTEAVARPGAVRELHLGLLRAIRLRPQQRVLDHPDVPASEVVRGHGQLARGEEPSLPFLRRDARRAEGVAHVARWL